MRGLVHLLGGSLLLRTGGNDGCGDGLNLGSAEATMGGSGWMAGFGRVTGAKDGPGVC